MAILMIALLIESCCAITLACCGAKLVAAAIPLVMAWQVYFTASYWNVEQSCKRAQMEATLLHQGKPYDEARMLAAYTYPDIRILAQAAKDLLL